MRHQTDRGIEQGGAIIDYDNVEMQRFTPLSSYVLELDIRAVVGSNWNGFGLGIWWYTDGLVYKGSDILSPASDKLPGNVSPAWNTGHLHRLRKLVTAPADARYGRLYIFGNYPDSRLGQQYNGTIPRIVEIYRAGIRGATPEEYETKNTLPALGASVSVNSGAIASIENTAAFTETIVAASGSNPAIMRMLAGKNGSGIDLVSDVLRIRNNVNGQLLDVATFEGGVARLNAALIRNLAVSPTATSNIFHKVQLEPIRITGSHGQAKQYQAGNTYSALPTISRDPTGEVLPTLPAGEAYDIRPVGITTSQFTIRAVKLVASGAAAQSSAAGANVGGTPQWQTNKPTTTNASDQEYIFGGSATLAQKSNYVFIVDENDPSTWRNMSTYEGKVTLYGKVGSTWTVLVTTTITRSYSTGTGITHPTTKSYSFGTEVVSGSDFGSGVNRFGIHPGTGATITAFSGVTYQTQTTSAEVALGGNFKFIINPPTE